MSMLEKLSAQDMEMIAEYALKYGGPNGTYSLDETIPMSRWLRLWDTEKETLYHLLGDNLMISKKITFEKSNDEIENDLAYKCSQDNEMGGFIRDFYSYINSHYSSNDNLWNSLDLLFRYQSLRENIYQGETRVLEVNGETYKLQQGAKVSKALGKLRELFGLDEETYEKFRISHSQVLNEKKITGDLYLSIHPMDFMTSSDNDSDWSSCMNWTDNGEYHRGTVEMMNSPMVVTAYITAKEPFDYGGEYKWNNKKWREFFIVRPDIITGIKGYPYWNRGIEDEVVRWLKDLCESAGFGKYSQEVIEWEPFKDFSNPSTGKSVHFRPDTHAMYNDFYFRHHGVIGTDATGVIEFCYSGGAVCLTCGQTDEEVSFGEESEWKLVCNLCYAEATCYLCGDTCSDYVIVDGETVCSYCAETNLPYCEGCGESHLQDCLNYAFVNIEPDENKPPRIFMPDAYQLCESCLDRTDYDYGRVFAYRKTWTGAHRRLELHANIISRKAAERFTIRDFSELFDDDEEYDNDAFFCLDESTPVEQLPQLSGIAREVF